MQQALPEMDLSVSLALHGIRDRHYERRSRWRSYHLTLPPDPRFSCVICPYPRRISLPPSFAKGRNSSSPSRNTVLHQPHFYVHTRTQISDALSTTKKLMPMHRTTQLHCTAPYSTDFHSIEELLKLLLLPPESSILLIMQIPSQPQNRKNLCMAEHDDDIPIFGGALKNAFF